MVCSIQGHISYILEAYSKRPIGKKRAMESYVEGIEWTNFFFFSNKNIS